MARRGPDGTGVYHDDDCTLLHSRLAVIDLQGGSQPMHLDWAGKRYSIVYNGELYNTDEIRSELLRQSHYFYTHSDTEVILHAFSQWGKECLQRLNGIFAFAVWESVEKKLFLARDRIGVRFARSLRQIACVKAVGIHEENDYRLGVLLDLVGKRF